MTKSRLQKLLDHNAVAGVAVGACAADEPWDDSRAAPQGEKAHAHIAGWRKGWICVRAMRNYNTTTIRHELAHLIRGDGRHDDAWRREVGKLGGRVERAYRKRSR